MKNRYSLVLLLGFIGALFISRKGITQDEGFLLWFAYVVICGLVINPNKDHSPPQLLLVGFGSGVILVLTILFRWLLTGNPPGISGEIVEPQRLFYILAALIPAGSVFICLTSISGDIILSGLKHIVNTDTKKLVKIEKNIKAILAILVALAAIIAFVR